MSPPPPGDDAPLLSRALKIHAIGRTGMSRRDYAPLRNKPNLISKMPIKRRSYGYALSPRRRHAVRARDTGFDKPRAQMTMMKI